MEFQHLKDTGNFFVAGINYKKSEASIRSSFGINNKQYSNILEKAVVLGLNELFILSTCNRTEIYGFAQNSNELINLLCSETLGNTAVFKKEAYIKKGRQAIEHLFEVGAGLDSQIVGDYEITGQLKSAVGFSKKQGFICAFTERLINSVLQASKLIKNNTELSGGTISVSFAAVQYIREKVTKPSQKNILLLGVGKIGRNTCKNLVDYLGATNITLINRSPQKAIELANSLNLKTALIENLEAEIKNADIILVATNAIEPIILKSHLEGENDKLIIDLSIPYNVEDAAQYLPNVQLVNVDELSKLKDDTLKARLAEIPKAKSIINGLMAEFNNWYEMRRHVPLLKQLKIKLREIHANPTYLHEPKISCEKKLDLKIQQVLNDTAGKIKLKNEGGCQYISAINNFISAGVN